MEDEQAQRKGGLGVRDGDKHVTSMIDMVPAVSDILGTTEFASKETSA